MTEQEVSTKELLNAGQSPWLDFISRDLLRSGDLKALVEDKGVIGVTSNPSIFEKAINQPKSSYETEIKRMIRKGASTFDIYDKISVEDIQEACDVLAPIYKGSDGEHGFVSLEVIPGLAYYEEDTVKEAVRLFKKVKRPNVMIKVPATAEGVAAVETLIGQGVNVNITLMFSKQHYIDVANAYIRGLETFDKSGGDVSRVHSVASVFVSRIDGVVDKRLGEMIKDASGEAQRAYLQDLQGKAAVANSKLIYSEFERLFNSRKFKNLETKGAWVQKVLWGSTSVKNPEYDDLLYVETLIGPETVNTMPMPTLEAFLDHGEVHYNSVKEKVDDAQATVDELKRLGINLEEIGEKLQKDGAKLFCDAFDSLMHSIENIKLAATKGKISSFSQVKLSLDKSTEKNLDKVARTAKAENWIARFFKKDPTLWKEDFQHQKVILNRLGWLDSVSWMFGKAYEVDALVDEVKAEGVQDVVLMGMGGSSLAPEVMNDICKRSKTKKPTLHIVDTTDPQTVVTLSNKLNFKKTIFIVASKSGSTVETVSQFRYFFELGQKKLGAKGDIGKQFIAITDSGSWLESEAAKLGFRRVFVNPTDIGGRFSALSFFGLVPVALAGVSIRPILKGALEFYNQSIQERDLKKNPGFCLGAALGVLAKEGRDKAILWTSKSIAPFGAWLEQLVAESTGKEGEGVVPVVGEAALDPKYYGDDNYLLLIKKKGEASAALDKKARVFKKAGFPVVELTWDSPESIGVEFLKWELATGVASAVLEINPFDEPNVKESKDITNKLLGKLKRSGKVQEPKDLIKLTATGATRGGKKLSVDALNSELFKSVKSDSYISLLAYTPRTPQFQKALSELQSILRKKFRVPVLVGFGPRYLHSIGQLYKGGPKKGVFVEFVMQDSKDAKVPTTHYKFSQLKLSQAFGDYEALKMKKVSVNSIQLAKKPLLALQKIKKAWSSIQK